METVILSGADFGGRTITGSYKPGDEVKVTEGEVSLKYRIINGQAVYDGATFNGNETEAVPDPLPASE